MFDEKSFHLSDYKDTRLVSVDVPFSPHVQHNGTLWAHIFVAESGAVMDPTDPAFDTSRAFRMVKLMTRYMPMKKVVKTKKLVGGKKDTEEEKEPEPEVKTVDEHGNRLIKSYWHSNLTMEIVAEPGTLDYTKAPPPLLKHIRLESSGKRDETGKDGWYYPIVYINDFWLLKQDMVELNDTVT